MREYPFSQPAKDLTKVTIMVNDANPQSFYALTFIQALVKQGHLTVANLRASQKLQDLGWDTDILKDFILALNESHFLKKYPQCSCAGSRNIDCDGYKMRFDEDERIEDKHNGLELFIKLAVSNRSRTLIVSFHTDSSPG